MTPSLQRNFAMATTSYTEFPSLSHRNNPQVGPGVAERLIEVGLDTSPDLLAISWAILLQSYTEDKTPIFRFDDRSVTVDCQDGASFSIQEIAGVAGSRYTGISGLEVGFSSSRKDGITHGRRIQKPMDSIYSYVTREIIHALFFIIRSAFRQNRYPMLRIS